MANIERVCETARSGNVKQLKQNLEKYGDANLWRRNRAGNFCLHGVISSHGRSEAIKLEVVTEILKRIPNDRIYEYLSLQNHGLQTVFHVAVQHCEDEVLDLLLDQLQVEERQTLLLVVDSENRSVWKYRMRETTKLTLSGYAQSPLPYTNSFADSLNLLFEQIPSEETLPARYVADSENASLQSFDYESVVEPNTPRQKTLRDFGRENSTRRSGKARRSLRSFNTPSQPDSCTSENQEYVVVPERKDESKESWAVSLVVDNTYSTIYRAVIKGNLCQVRRILAGIKSPHAKRELLLVRDLDGKTLLHHTVSRNRLQILKELLINIPLDYRQALEVEDFDGKTANHYEKSSKVKEYLGYIYSIYWQASLRQPNFLIVSIGLNFYETAKLTEQVYRMVDRGMAVDHFTERTEDEAINAINQIQLQNPAAMIVMIVENSTGSNSKPYHTDHIVGAMCTTAMLHKPKVLLWQRTDNAQKSVSVNHDGSDDLMIILSSFKARLFSESLAMSLCSTLTSTHRPVSLDELLRLNPHADQCVKHDTLQYQLMVGPPHRTVVQKIRALFKRHKPA